jgi:hypothetical protein
MILTTGSRSGADRSRLNASAEILAIAGADRSELFGDTLDRDLYAVVLAGILRRFYGGRKLPSKF